MTEVEADSVQFLEPKPSSNQSSAPNQSGYTRMIYNTQNRQETISNQAYGQSGDLFNQGGLNEDSDDDLPF